MSRQVECTTRATSRSCSSARASSASQTNGSPDTMCPAGLPCSILVVVHVGRGWSTPSTSRKSTRIVHAPKSLKYRRAQLGDRAPQQVRHVSRRHAVQALPLLEQVRGRRIKARLADEVVEPTAFGDRDGRVRHACTMARRSRPHNWDHCAHCFPARESISRDRRHRLCRAASCPIAERAGAPRAFRRSAHLREGRQCEDSAFEIVAHGLSLGRRRSCVCALPGHGRAEQ